MVEAARLYKLAAKGGYAMAQFNLGCCYDYGKGVEQGLVEAARLMKLAAEGGDAMAQFNLGCCLQRW